MVAAVPSLSTNTTSEENNQETQKWIQSIQKQIEDEKMKSDELEALKIATQEDLQNSSQAYQQQKIKDVEITRYPKPNPHQLTLFLETLQNADPLNFINKKLPS